MEARKAAIGLFERGHGFEWAAKALSDAPRDTVRQWLYVYRSFGSSRCCYPWNGEPARYTYEQKVAAASAVVDGGMGKRDVMEAFGVMSSGTAQEMVRQLYREGGAEALRARAQGQAEGCPGPRPRGRTREQELSRNAAEGSETEMAYLEKLACPGREGRALGPRTFCSRQIAERSYHGNAPESRQPPRWYSASFR